jgi:UDP-3-O-[3-hydroxymyristoyl] glucosamine N-acyltransferase
VAVRDDRFSHTLGELAAVVGGAAIRGDPDLPITGVSGLSEAAPGEIVFYNNARYREALAATRASAVLVEEASALLVKGPAVMVVADPYLAFAKIAAVFHPPQEFAPGIDPRAIVETGAVVDPTATVMAFCFVSRDSSIGPKAVLFPQVFVGAGARIGAGALLYPQVVVREGCTVGARVILQPGVVVGGDGFGFAYDAKVPEHFKIPQAGIVEIQDEAEIGANSAVDRATFGKTVIGRGSKLDNLVQVGHNVQVGALCLLCGQVGIAGSARLGQGVACGGQVGIANHVRVADGARLAAQSGIKDDLEAGDHMGSPALPIGEYVRAHLAFRRGAETRRLVLRLEKRIAELEARLEALSKLK